MLDQPARLLALRDRLVSMRAAAAAAKLMGVSTRYVEQAKRGKPPCRTPQDARDQRGEC